MSTSIHLRQGLTGERPARRTPKPSLLDAGCKDRPLTPFTCVQCGINLPLPAVWGHPLGTQITPVCEGGAHAPGFHQDTVLGPALIAASAESTDGVRVRMVIDVPLRKVDA